MVAPNKPGVDNQFITQLQSMLNQGKQTAGVNSSVVSRNPEVAALVSKLVTKPVNSISTTSIENGELSMVAPGVDQISKRIMSKVEDAENTFKLFPDIKLAEQIVISSILSPKDMLKTELIYRFEDSDYPPAMTSRIIDIVREEFEKYYNIKDELYDIIRDAMFRAGAHPKIVLPEAAVDHVINSGTLVATESLSETNLFIGNDPSVVKSIGFLGNPNSKKENKPALESFFGTNKATDFDGTIRSSSVVLGDITKYEGIDVQGVKKLIEERISVVDNCHFLKVPDLVQVLRQQKVDAVLGKKTLFSKESFDGKKVSPAELSSMLYKGSNGEYKPYTSIPSSGNLRRRSVGRPLVINASAESMIPIYIPGDYRRHIGYFFVTDGDGNPVTIDSQVNEFGQGLNSLLQGDKTGNGTGAQLTDKAAKNLISDQHLPVIDRIGELVSEIIDRDLIERLANGVYGQELSVGKNNDVYRIMLARALKGQYTRLVYIPAEYVSYFAFEYHRNGTGRSYLDDLSNIIGMRAMVLFSKIWAQVRSSISTVTANIVFDPKEPDPVKIIEMVKSLVARSRQQFFPNGLRNVSDFTDWIHRAGIEITYEGHPRLPDTKINFESKNIDHVQPNDELDELLRHMCYMHFGLSPETVDSAAKADFATTIQQGSILFARRVMVWSKIFSSDMTEHISRVARSDEVIKARIVEVLEEFKTDILESFTEEQKKFLTSDKVGFTHHLLNDIFSRIRVSLPEPDTISQNTMAEEVDNYEKLIDKALSYIFSDDMLPEELIGQTKEYISNIQAAYKAEVMRRYFANNNIVPEVFDIVSRDADDQPMENMNKSIRDHSMNSIAAVLSLIKMMETIRKAADKDVEALKVEPGEGGSSSSGDSSTDSGGSDDFGFGDDLGGGEDPFADSEGGSPDEAGQDEAPEEAEPEPDDKPADAEPEA